jgi:hypothetical protein
MTPQPGIEVVNGLLSPAVPVYATDLSGNVIWWYKYTDGSASDSVNPIRFLPNGNFLLSIGAASSTPLHSPPLPGTISVLREIDLAGTTVRELSLADLNLRLSAAGIGITALAMHHDLLPLENGHWIVILSSFKHFDNVAGFGPADVLGDSIVDLDEHWNPVWFWSAFDHLDVNRHPVNFPDWTHANSLTYVPQDGSLLLSMRHQSWIVKIDYKNGSGSGDILWRLGQGGDMTLIGGQDPTDWFYDQHGHQIVSNEGPGVFSLSVMDNGNDRLFPGGITCAMTGFALCPYSTGVIYRIDESAKSATITTLYKPGVFSFFGGFTTPLPNGHLEMDFCAARSNPNGALVQEITTGPNPQLVWQMEIRNQFAYRAFRQPSLYPGVQW